MTLDLAQYFANIINRESKISHFQTKIYCGEPSKLKQQYKSLIQKKYGEKYLLDADYLMIFRDGDIFDENSKKRLFKLVDSALGTNANNLSKSDFKYIETHEPTDDSENSSDIPSSFYFLKVTLK